MHSHITNVQAIATVLTGLYIADTQRFAWVVREILIIQCDQLNLFFRLADDTEVLNASVLHHCTLRHFPHLAVLLLAQIHEIQLFFEFAKLLSLLICVLQLDLLLLFLNNRDSAVIYIVTIIVSCN